MIDKLSSLGGIPSAYIESIWLNHNIHSLNQNEFLDGEIFPGLSSPGKKDPM